MSLEIISDLYNSAGGPTGPTGSNSWNSWGMQPNSSSTGSGGTFTFYFCQKSVFIYTFYSR